MMTSVALLLSVAVGMVSDTSRGPCGWDAANLDVTGMPVTVSLLTAELQAGSQIPDDAVGRLLRWVHSCDEFAGHEAVSDIRRFASKHSADPAAQALLAVFLARGPEVQIVGSAGTVFRAAYKYSNSEKEAARIFSKVLAAHPWPEVATEFANLATEVRTPGTLEAARDALIKATNASGSNAAVWGALGDVALALEDDTLMMKAAARALELHDPAGMRRYAIGQILTENDPAPGAARYLEGLAKSDDATLELYHEDLLPLFTNAESAMWDSIATPSRREWIRKSWEWRASIATLSLPARLKEHFRRVRYAYTNYFRGQYRGGAPISALWLDPALEHGALGDRGMVYVRHGAPDTVIRMHGMSYRIAWYYRSLGGGRALLEFNKTGFPVAWSEYYLAEPFRCSDTTFADGPHPSRARTMINGDAAADFMEEILALDPSIEPDACYNTIAGDTGAVHLTHVSSAEARKVVSQAVMQTETAAPRLRKPIDALLNTYAFRQDTGTAIIAFVSANAGELQRDTTVAQPQYRLKVFAAVENARTHTVTRSDTTLGINPPTQFRNGDAIDMTLALEGTTAPLSTIRVAIRNTADTTQGQIVSTAREIPDYRAAGLLSSDVILGRAGSERWSVRRDAPVPLPGHRMKVDEAFVVYYELYGVHDAGAMEATIAITPEPRRGVTGAIADLIKQRRAISVQYTDRIAPDVTGMTIVKHEVQAALEPGAYFVDITTRIGGQTVTKRTTLTVYK